MSLDSLGLLFQVAIAATLALLALGAALPGLRRRWRAMQQSTRDAISRANRRTLPDSKRCTAFTKAGSRCRAHAIASGLCYAHHRQQAVRGFP